MGQQGTVRKVTKKTINTWQSDQNLTSVAEGKWSEKGYR
jgi:hypothetical protein